MILFFYIITVGFTSAALGLSLLYWMQKRNSGRLNTFAFILYLTLLLLLGGVRFYWEDLLAGGRAVKIGTGLAEFAGYALLLYFLPATVNHIAGRPWTALRLTASITAGIVYVALGTVYLFTGFLKPIALAAALLYMLALAIILTDIVRGIPEIKHITTRATVLLITLLTVVFLPLVMVGRLLDGSGERWEINLPLRFLFLTMYYFLMALSGIIFYFREMARNPLVSFPAGKEFSEFPLTTREKNIAHFVVRGLSYTEIAHDLDISPNTVRNHVANIYKKLAIRSRLELFHLIGEQQT